MTLTLVPRPIASTGSHTNSIIDYLEHWAAVQPNKCFSSFLDVDSNERDTHTYLSFHERTRQLAEYLSRDMGLMRGDRVLSSTLLDSMSSWPFLRARVSA